VIKNGKILKRKPPVNEISFKTEGYLLIGSAYGVCWSLYQSGFLGTNQPYLVSGRDRRSPVSTKLQISPGF
jgi:hypothetical protein